MIVLPNFFSNRRKENMNELKIFENPDFGQIRVVNINGEPWLVGKDVAGVLGYANSKDALAKHVDTDDKTIFKGSDLRPLGNANAKDTFLGDIAEINIPNRGITVINESGLYSLVFGSKMANAKKFKHWVTSEVLPSIRKTGGYSLNIPKNLPEALRAYAAEIEAHEQTKTALAKKEKKIALDAPKVDFYDSVANSESLLSFEKVAKLIAKKGLGRNKLIGWLRDLKLLRKTESGNVPYQQYVNKGYFKLVESNRVINGYERVFTTTYVTQKGLDYILKLSKYYEKE